MEAYGFNEDCLTLLYSYPKRQKQFMNINIIHSIFQILLSGVLQGSILGPLFFNIFISDQFYFIKEAQLLRFADGNTVVTFSNSVDYWSPKKW